MALWQSITEHAWRRMSTGRGLELRGCSASLDAARRAEFEHFIAACFAEHYGARLRQFMPCLLGLEDEAGQLQAVAGLRVAGPERLFLERYLPELLEQRMARLRGLAPIAREQLAEIGNLAAIGTGNARLLIVTLTPVLVASGIRWVAFTATALLLNSFQRLGVPLVHLGTADGRCLGDELADWGSYYATHPQVMVADVLATHQRLQAAGIYRRLGCRLREGFEPEYADVAC